MKISSRNANLRAVLADDDTVRQTVHEMMTVMKSVEDEDTRGFRLASLLEPDQPVVGDESHTKSIQLGEQEYQLLHELIKRTSGNKLLILPRHARSLEKISIRGVSYATSHGRNFRDSNIIFEPHKPHLTPHGQRAGAIDSIFQYQYSADGEQKKDYYISIRAHFPLTSPTGTTDPYRKYGFAGGFLCKPGTPELHVINASHIISHCSAARIKVIGEDFIHVLPLDRVRKRIHACLTINPPSSLQRMMSLQTVGIIDFPFESLP